ncbi:FUSC family protein [Corynebacterium sp.]|uniref:FUSC family protein n=1 Tax=Corynebacterium sp. TaxID=1720 RepID=UPI0026DEFB2B|nr:FUSC family protein [Corynebacterium sp.]MDO5511777.1 FUSC family protein [Corynebacterium sp.]
MMETPPPRPSAWQLFTAFHAPGPRWPGALRAGLAMGLPGTVAILLGFEAELLLIAAGSFTVIHGEGYAYRARWKVLLTAGALFATGAVSGAFVGTVVWGQIEAGATRWWLLLTVAFATSIAGLGIYVANALRLPPPGPWFLLLVTGASTMTYRLGLNPVEVGAWALIGVASSIVVGMSPALVNPRGPETRAVAVLEEIVADLRGKVSVEKLHQAQTALSNAWVTLGDAGAIYAGRINDTSGLAERTLAAQARLVGTSSQAVDELTDSRLYIDVDRVKVPHARPSISYRLYRSVHRDSHAMMTATRVVLACLGAGVLSIALGFNRPDWAIVSALLILQWGPDKIPGTIRGIHRLIGSVLGVMVFGALYLLDVHAWTLMLALSVCLFFSEIFVVRNYAVAVIFTTPVALMLGGALGAPLEQTMRERVIEILFSVVFALVLLWLFRPDAEPAHHLGLQNNCRRAMESLLGALLTSTPEEALDQRRDLQYELLSERRAAQSLARNNPDIAHERWSEHLELQRAGYALLDWCAAEPDTRLPLGDIQALAERIS